jgi:cyclopropane-fatty-acyl-phospholipid synthase
MSIRSTLVKNLLKTLNNIETGSLILITPKGVARSYTGKNKGASATITIHDWQVIENIVSRGDIGLGEDYIAGLWNTDNLENFMTLIAQNMKHFEAYAHGTFKSRIFFFFNNNILRRNSKNGSKKNIVAHYDVGNDFYKLWLDESMTYSSAIFNSINDNLNEAQHAKYNRILSKIGQGRKNILEIGCGWGGFSEAATNMGYNVQGITISPSQYEIAKTRVSGDSQIHLKDYRDVTGMFDAIVSIEMFEAVGEKYWKEYFQNIKSKLKFGGKALIQTITIEDSIFDNYRKRSDFIREYTFPGGMLPSVNKFKEEAKKSELVCKEVFSFGKDYASTLRYWLKRFDEKQAEIKSMGYSEAFIKNWRFYLASSIAAFESGRTNVVQIELEHA